MIFQLPPTGTKRYSSILFASLLSLGLSGCAVVAEPEPPQLAARQPSSQNIQLDEVVVTAPRPGEPTGRTGGGGGGSGYGGGTYGGYGGTGYGYGVGGGSGSVGGDRSADGISSISIIIPSPVVNPRQETKCFTTSQGANLTIYVQEAKSGTRNKVGPAQVGHTFVGIEQNGITRYLGYYPQSTANSALVGVGVSYPGELHDNSGSPYDVSITSPVSSSQLASMIDYINNYPTTYNLNSYNCADFGIAVGNLGGMNLPATTTRVALFDGRSPGDLGEDIRAMSIAPANGSIDKTGGNAPSKQGTCP